MNFNPHLIHWILIKILKNFFSLIPLKINFLRALPVYHWKLSLVSVQISTEKVNSFVVFYSYLLVKPDSTLCFFFQAREGREEGRRRKRGGSGRKRRKERRKRLIIKAKYLNPREYGFSSAECSFPVYTPLENKRGFCCLFLVIKVVHTRVRKNWRVLSVTPHPPLTTSKPHFVAFPSRCFPYMAVWACT